MDFLSNLIKRPISSVLNDTGASSSVATTAEKSPTTKLQLQDNQQQHGTIEQNESIPPLQYHPSKCKRHAIFNEDETIGHSQLIENRDPWQLLSITSTSASTSSPSMRHQTSIASNSSSNTLTNAIGNAIPIPINCNNVSNLSDQFHDKHRPLTPLKVDLKSSMSNSFIQTPLGTPKTIPSLSRGQSLSPSTRKLSSSETIEKLLIEINDNINQAVGTPPMAGGATFDDVFDFNALIKSPNQPHSPLMATKAISPLINAKSAAAAAAAAAGTPITTPPLTPTDGGGGDGDGSNMIIKPTNKMSRSFELTTTKKTTPKTSNTIGDMLIKSKTGISNCDTMQQYSNLDDNNGDCDILLNGHNKTPSATPSAPTTPKTSTVMNDLNNYKSPTHMNKLINNKLDAANEISPLKTDMNDSENNVEGKVRINFEECIIPEMQLNIETVEEASIPLATSSARGKYQLMVPNESDTAPSSDNELYTDCTDGGELMEKDPLSNTNPIEEPLNDTNTDLDSYCSAVNEIVRHNDDDENDKDNNVLDDTADSIIDLTMDEANDSNQNNETLQVANNKQANKINDSDIEEPMDVDINETLEMLNSSSNSTKTLTAAAATNVNENNRAHSKECHQSQIETNVKGKEYKVEENVHLKTEENIEKNHEQCRRTFNISQEINDNHVIEHQQLQQEKIVQNNCEFKTNNLDGKLIVVSSTSISALSFNIAKQQQEQESSKIIMNIKKADNIEEKENFKSKTIANNSIKPPLNDTNKSPIQTINVNPLNSSECSTSTLDRKYNSMTKVNNNDDNEQANDKKINQMCKSDSQIPSITKSESLELKSEKRRRTFNVPLSSTSNRVIENNEMDNLNALHSIKTRENENINEVNENRIEFQLCDNVDNNGKQRRRTFNVSQEINDNHVTEHHQKQQQQEIVNNSCEPMDIDDEISPHSSNSNLHGDAVDIKKLSPMLQQQQVNYTSDSNPKSAALDNSPTSRKTDDDANAQDNIDETKAKMLSTRLIQKRPSIRDYKKSLSNETNLSTEATNVNTVQDKDKNTNDEKYQMSNKEQSSMMDKGCSNNDNTFKDLSPAIKSSERNQSQQQLSDCNDPEFEQQFNTNNLILQPNDFDYLLSKGNNNVPVVSDRSSLLLKFDPLIGAPVPVIAANQHHHQQQQQQQQQQLFLQLSVNNTNNTKILSPTKEEEEEEEEEQQKPQLKQDRQEQQQQQEQDKEGEEGSKGKTEKKETDSLEVVEKEEEGTNEKQQVEKEKNNQDKETCEEASKNQNIEQNLQNSQNENHNKNEDHHHPNTIKVEQHLTEEGNSMQNNQISVNFTSNELTQKQLIKPKSEQQQQQQQLIDLTDKEKKKNAIMSVDVDVIKDMNLDNDCNKAYENSNSTQSEDKQQSNYKMDELEKKIKNEVLKTEDIEKKLKDAEQREEALIKRITEKDRTISKMNNVIEAYEKAIAEFIAEKEQLMQNYEKQLAEVKADRDSNYHHLTSLETTFSDLHVKYEKSKEMTSQLKANEEVLLGEKRQYMENLRLQEQRYEKMKSHAMQQLEIANKKLETLGREHAMETTKLKALLKKEEIARISITEQLTQKTKENMELMKICDELIQGQES